MSSQPTSMGKRVASSRSNQGEHPDRPGRCRTVQCNGKWCGWLRGKDGLVSGLWLKKTSIHRSVLLYEVGPPTMRTMSKGCSTARLHYEDRVSTYRPAVKQPNSSTYTTLDIVCALNSAGHVRYRDRGPARMMVHQKYYYVPSTTPR